MKLIRLTDDRFLDALEKLSKEELPLKTAFKLKGILKVVREELSKYEEVRKTALNRHGVKNEDGTLRVDERNLVQFDAEGMKSFTADMNEFMSLELNIPTITLAELGEKANLKVEILEILDGLIVE